MIAFAIIRMIQEADRRACALRSRKTTRWRCSQTQWLPLYGSTLDYTWSARKHMHADMIGVGAADGAASPRPRVPTNCSCVNGGHDGGTPSARVATSVSGSRARCSSLSQGQCVCVYSVCVYSVCVPPRGFSHVCILPLYLPPTCSPLPSEAARAPHSRSRALCDRSDLFRGFECEPFLVAPVYSYPDVGR